MPESLGFTGITYGGRKKNGRRCRKGEPASDNGEFTVATLKVLFKLRVPNPQQRRTDFLSNDDLPENCYTSFRLAFIQPLEALRSSIFGEMIPVPKIAVFKLPDAETDTSPRMRELEGVVVEIGTIHRTAHFIPIHDNPNIVSDTDKRWIHNNRIDVGTWDLIYGNVL